MTVAPSGIRTDARGPTALMRDPLTTTTASGSGGPPFPSITAHPTMAIVAPCEPGALDATRLMAIASPSHRDDSPLDINHLRAFLFAVAEWPASEPGTCIGRPPLSLRR